MKQALRSIPWHVVAVCGDAENLVGGGGLSIRDQHEISTMGVRWRLVSGLDRGIDSASYN